MAMKRDYPRDDFGRKVPGSSRELVVDPRPTILKRENKERHIRSHDTV
jgi:hypothetical protein